MAFWGKDAKLGRQLGTDQQAQIATDTGGNDLQWLLHGDRGFDADEPADNDWWNGWWRLQSLNRVADDGAQKRNRE